MSRFNLRAGTSLSYRLFALIAILGVGVFFVSSESSARTERVITGDGKISFSVSGLPQIFDDILSSSGNMGNCQKRIQWVSGKTALKIGKNNFATLTGSVNYAQWLCSNLGDTEESSKKYKVQSRILVDFDETSKLLYVKAQVINAETLPGVIASKFKTTYTLARVNMSKFLVRFNNIKLLRLRSRKDDLNITVSFEDNNIPATR